LVKFANQIVNQNLDTGDPTLPVATFSRDLATTDDQASDKNCPSTALREGVQAVAFDYDGTPDDSIIAMADSAKYCYWYNSVSSRIVFVPMPTGGCSTMAPQNAKQLNNPLVAFLVSKWPSPKAPAPSAQQVVGDNKPSPVTGVVAQNAFTSFISRTAQQGTVIAGNMDPSRVKALFDALTEKPLDSSVPLASLVSQSNAQEAATALALKHCLIVGIAPKDCN
jgi:hypothetical protein